MGVLKKLKSVFWREKKIQIELSLEAFDLLKEEVGSSISANQWLLGEMEAAFKKRNTIYEGSVRERSKLFSEIKIQLDT